MHNPLEAEMNLSNVTLVVEAKAGASEQVEVEIIKEVTLGAKETISVSSILIICLGLFLRNVKGSNITQSKATHDTQHYSCQV